MFDLAVAADVAVVVVVVVVVVAAAAAAAVPAVGGSGSAFLYAVGYCREPLVSVLRKKGHWDWAQKSDFDAGDVAVPVAGDRPLVAAVADVPIAPSVLFVAAVRDFVDCFVVCCAVSLRRWAHRQKYCSSDGR